MSVLFTRIARIQKQLLTNPDMNPETRVAYILLCREFHQVLSGLYKEADIPVPQRVDQLV